MRGERRNRTPGAANHHPGFQDQLPTIGRRSPNWVTGGDRTRTSSFTARRALQYTTATMRSSVGSPELESNQRHRLQRPAHDLRSGKVADATNEVRSSRCPHRARAMNAARSRIERINELRRLVASVGVEGIEPPSAVCRTAALPLDETPIVPSDHCFGLMLVAAWA
jgi:hypothetical protein